MFSRSPKTVSCPACGGPFFAASLPFHLKECAKRKFTTCISCLQPVRHCNIDAHMDECPGRKPKLLLTIAAETEQMEIAEPNSDGRVPCGSCQRCFAPDRIRKHQTICSKMRCGPSMSPSPSRPSTSSILVSRSGRGGGKGQCLTQQPHPQSDKRERRREKEGFDQND
jgi:hypothetical protein